MKRIGIRKPAVALLGGAVYALFAALGRQAQHDGQSDPLRALLVAALLLPPFSCALAFLSERAGRKARPVSLEDREAFCARRTFCLIFACYVPMFLITFPGSFAYDVPFQLKQVFTGAYSTHHPLVHTLLLGGCVALGRALGCVNAGAALYTLVQMALLALCFTAACASIARRCGGRSAFRAALCFALYPLHMMMAVNATKDVLFSGCFALLLALSLEAAHAPHCGGGLGAGIAAAAACSMLLRNNMLYAVLVWAALLPLLLRRRGCRLAGLMLLAAALACGTNAVLSAATGAQPGDASEMLSWPIQQLARARNLNADRLSQEEIEAMDELMPGEAWRLYDPTISDSVKFEFDTRRLMEDLPRYLGVYLSVGAKCPKTYFDAVLMLTYSFLYPYSEYGVSGYYLQMGVTDQYYDGWYEGERITSASLFPRVLASLSWRFGAQGAMQIPVIGWAFNMGLIVWAMLYLVLRQAYRGAWRCFAVMLLPVLLWGTFLLGPVMAGRYVYPFVCALPVMAAREKKAE